MFSLFWNTVVKEFKAFFPSDLVVIGTFSAVANFLRWVLASLNLCLTHPDYTWLRLINIVQNRFCFLSKNFFSESSIQTYLLILSILREKVLT